MEEIGTSKENYYDELCKILQTSLKKELTSSVLYLKLSKISSHPKIVEQMIEHANDEHMHFQKLLTFVYDHDYQHNIDFSDLLDTDELTAFYSGNDNEAIFIKIQDLEIIDRTRYELAFQFARDNEDLHAEELFKDLAIAEKEHYDDLNQYNKSIIVLQDTVIQDKVNTSGRISFTDYVAASAMSVASIGY